MLVTNAVREARNRNAEGRVEEPVRKFTTYTTEKSAIA